MQVTHKFEVKLINQSQIQLLKDGQMNCATVWNEIIRISKEEWHQNKSWISKFDLQKVLAGQFPVQRHTLNALTDKFEANRKTISKLRLNGNRKMKYPYKEKQFFTIPFKESAIKIKDDTIRLTLARGLHVEIYNIDRIDRTPYAEIVWRNGKYYFHYTKEVTMQVEKDFTTPCGVDIGEIHTLALSTPNKALVISGRAVRSVKQWRNKSLGYVSKRLSKCTKGSRSFKKWMAVKNYIKTRSKNQLEDLYHKAARQAINFCIEKDISDLVIGELKGVEKNTKKKNRLNRKNRQKVSQMAYGKIADFLKYKAQMAGIRTMKKSEYLTSQTCPSNSKHTYKPSGRMYQCPTCGCTIHRDVNGAFNIMKKAFPSIEYSYIQVTFKQPLRYKVSTN